MEELKADTTLEREYALGKNRIAPVSKLPDELLIIIFLEASKGRFFSRLQRDDMWLPPIEIIISHVAQRWRRVALGSPMLWTHIIAAAENSHEALFSTCLERSGQLPFHLGVDLCDAKLDPLNNFRFITYFPAWLWVAPYLHRAQSLHIRCCSSWILSYWAQDAFVRRVPLLESFTIWKGADGVLLRPGGFFLAGAPKLSSLRFEGVHLRGFLPPLGKITFLSLTEGGLQGRMLWSELYDLLNDHPHLSQLEIGDIFMWEMNVTNLQITLPSLRRLRILMQNGLPDLSKMMHGLSAPSLEIIQLDGLTGNDLIRLNDSPSLLSWSDIAIHFPRHHTLCLKFASTRSKYQITLNCWRHFFRLFQSTTHLICYTSAGERNTKKKLFSFLNLGADVECLPLLQTFAFATTPCFLESLSGFVEEKKGAGRPLTEVLLPMDELRGKEHQKDLWRLRDTVQVKGNYEVDEELFF